MDIDILSLLKNYSPHDLAAFYQHWGFVDPRLDPQGKEEALVCVLFAPSTQRIEARLRCLLFFNVCDTVNYP